MSFAEQIAIVQNNIAQHGITERKPQIIAVSKRQPEPKIQEALDYGWRIFGENQVQEAVARWQERKKTLPDLKLHLIGPLQSNKVKPAVDLFDVIHTLDREKIAVKLMNEMQIAERNLPCFVQVNIGCEESKSGVEPDMAQEFVSFCRQDIGLTVVGLMCIPPIEENSEPYFARMQQLNRACGLTQLSMGMSDDYPLSVRHGSTHVRVGSFLFGKR